MQVACQKNEDLVVQYEDVYDLHNLKSLGVSKDY